MSGGNRRSVLFVCMGNICRSPAAEGVMERLIEERGVGDRVEVDSAGTIGYHAGAPADSRMREAAERRGYELTSRARKVAARDFGRFDLVVAMDRENQVDLEELAADASDAGAELVLLSDFLPEGSPVDVPDPYYGGEQGFEQVLDMLEEATPAILDRLLADAG